MKDGEELLKYITERTVKYIETPKSERKQLKRSETKELWKYRWFGMLPLAFQMWRKRRK